MATAENNTTLSYDPNASEFLLEISTVEDDLLLMTVYWDEESAKTIAETILKILRRH